MEKGKMKATVAIVTATVLYGFEWFFVGKLNRLGMNPFAITFGIVVFAWIGLVLSAGISKTELLPKSKNDLRSLIWLGLYYSVHAILFFAALAKGQVATVLMLYCLAPVWTVLLAKIVLGEKLTKNKMFSLGLSLFGLLVAFDILGFDPIGQNSRFVLPNLFALFAGIFAAGKTILSGKTKHLSEQMRSFWMFSLSSLILLAANIVHPSHFSHDWLLILTCFLFLGVGIQLVSVLLIQYAFRYLEASVIGMLLLLEIVFGVLSAWLIGNQIPSATVLIGIGFITLSCITLKTEVENDIT